MSDLSTTAVADAPAPDRTLPSTIVLTEKDFATLVDLRQRCEEARARYNSAAEDAKSKKKAFEGAREVFETNFDRIVKRTKGEDLPLFNQSELLERAQADPVVMKLVDRLLANGHDVNAIIVAGYTQDERAQASAYLDALDAVVGRVVTGEASDSLADSVVDVPAFLLPQPLTPIELADLAKRLKAEDFTVTPEQLAEFSKAQIAEVRDFLDKSKAVRAEKDDSVTFDDLPDAPEFLIDANDPTVDTTEDDDETNDPSVH
jgi:hypothetical protein